MPTLTVSGTELYYEIRGTGPPKKRTTHRQHRTDVAVKRNAHATLLVAIAMGIRSRHA
jgi:hypothetical protein